MDADTISAIIVYGGAALVLFLMGASIIKPPKK